MNAVEIIALIFAITALLKFVFLLVKPKWFINIGKNFIEKTMFLKGFLIILIVIMGYFMLQTMTMAQIFVASIFGIYVYALIFTQYPKLMKSFYKSVMTDMKKLWLPFLIWTIMAIWVIWELFL